MPPLKGPRPLTATERSRETRDRQRAYVEALEAALTWLTTTPKDRTPGWFLECHAPTITRARAAVAARKEGE